MNNRLILSGTLAYALVTFSLAVVWHVVLFEEQYRTFGYIEGDPNFALGFLTIFIQGYVLSLLYPYVRFSGKAVIRGLKFSLLIGTFFWTSHILAFVAKQAVDGPLFFVFMESFYLLMQFGVFGVLIGYIYRKATD